MPVKFLLNFNAAVIKEIPLPDTVSSLTVGRKEDNDIVIDHPAVSVHHARFFRVGSSHFIRDSSTKKFFQASL
ncbi:MAG: FHA domain-containing protein [Elusimicrobiota bacterium]|nr:FHA domain-containing protein [Elusimicrobiota bacterium]